ncbi:S-layer homology domain-containing protein [Leptolyngbya sp. PCC 6406]|uniref:S-layer homology domain-containing protein n=1 Tax=Leptolyngbya sp. PCC 6406 TaxID=1173264 RepID=UPI0002ABC308|nr:S-layer homology domain-containing protein [Leptolyngbya sp. PCC 6406]
MIQKVVGGTIALWAMAMGSAIAFQDTSNHWARPCIDQLRAAGQISGYPDNTFRPQVPVTRTEYAVFLLNAFPREDHWLQAATAPLGGPQRDFSYGYEDPRLPGTARHSPHHPTPEPIRFVDVPTHYWGYAAIQRASGRRFFVGYPDGTFRPQQAIPRIQAIAVLAQEMRYGEAEHPEAVLTRYFDDAAEIPAYARPAIATATLGRLAVNPPQVRRLRPNHTTTRAEVAALLCQALGLARTVPLDYIAAGDQFAIPPEAGGRRPFAEGLAVAAVNGRYGYINTQGALAIPADYDQASDFKAGIAAVTRQGQPQFIDRTGTAVQPPPGYIPATSAVTLNHPPEGLWLRPFHTRTIEYISGIGLGQVPVYDTATVGGIWGYVRVEP